MYINDSLYVAAFEPGGFHMESEQFLRAVPVLIWPHHTPY